MSTIQQKQLPHEDLKRLGVEVVYLFGSQAEGVAGKASDIDIGIVLKESAPKPTTELYNKLFHILHGCFDMSNFRTMDIVFLQRASLELQFDVIRHGKVLFESSSDVRMNFEERVATLYRDFKPILKQFNNAILERI